MPWTTLITGCLAGTAVLAIVALIAHNSHWPLGQGAVRTAILPAIAALAFVPRTWFRPVTQATPVPAWIGPVGHIVLAAPVLATTCWAQLLIMTQTITTLAGPLSDHSHLGAARPPAVYPLIAQVTGWCVITLAAAACAYRSRYADLGGAIAAPVGLAAIALAWYTPITKRALVEPPASAHAVTIVWYTISAAAAALMCTAMRDRWHRYSCNLHRPSSSTSNLT